jgi:hypothetical protein
MTRSKRRRELDAGVRAAADVLRRDWDPIGGGLVPGLPADEYDLYAPHVVSMLENGDTDRAIASYLKQLEDQTIECGSGRDLLVVAARLRAAVADAVPRT